MNHLMLQGYDNKPTKKGYEFNIYPNYDSLANITN